MVRFDIAFSEEAKNDIQNLSDAIMYQYKAPTTAFGYIQGLLDEIKKLWTHAESYSIQASSYFSQYGFNDNYGGVWFVCFGEEEVKKNRLNFMEEIQPIGYLFFKTMNP